MEHLRKEFSGYFLRFSLFSAWSSLSHEETKVENAIIEKTKPKELNSLYCKCIKNNSKKVLLLFLKQQFFFTENSNTEKKSQDN